MSRIGRLCALALALAALPTLARAQQTCDAAAISAIVERTGTKLRAMAADGQPKLQARLRELAQRQGWSEAEADGRGNAFLADDEARSLDDQAAELLVTFEHLSSAPPNCQNVSELNTTASQLIEVTAAKAAHMSARLDLALKTPAGPKVAAATEPPAKAAEPPAKTAKPDAPKTEPAKPEPPKHTAAAAPPPAKPRSQPWQTETRSEPLPPVVVPKPEVIASLPPHSPELADLEFSVEDINAAGRGFFGSISAGLAGVIEFAFQKYGRPTGYILGNEGGGALFAGLRFGDGTLVTKAAGERKVYWQGPSVGYDFGLAGSRVMFLVYNIRDSQQLFERYAGVDGSAYLVGGVGITFLKKGKIALAPIRSGIGLRLGANVGYLKFTPSPSINPF